MEGYYRGRAEARDGNLQSKRLTVKALQQFLRNKEGGHMHCNRYLQQLQNPVDGDLGGVTVKSLQQFLWTEGHYGGRVEARDGNLQSKPKTVKALQQFLFNEEAPGRLMRATGLIFSHEAYVLRSIHAR